MGKQNDAFTAYLGRAEVLADLYNGCLYQGEEVVRAGNLCEVQQFYQQGLSERVKRPTARRRERDAIRAFWNEKSYVLLAAEAQNQPHLTMPFRCMEYDGRICQTASLYPAEKGGKIKNRCRVFKSDQQNGRSDLRYDLRDVKSERTTGQERKISEKWKGEH